ncbi:unnamed protein product [Ilex paraguariensis]|uniref:Ribosome-recycling factor, chloroplastic n=1 Tax=Ilex paraguariensis TaxID=185542 RepID=A0ABC8RSE6_9AQUA
MAISFSPATPLRSIYQQPSHKPNPPKSLLSLQDSNYGGPSCARFISTPGDVFGWRSASNYVKLQVGATKFAAKLLVVKQSSHERTGVLRCATIEEIEAEKSLIEKNVKEKMEKTIDTVRSNFNSIRTGRSTPSMLDKVEVEYYGTPVSLKSIAQISTPDASSILVQPYDKSSLKIIEKALVSSDLGLTPNNDGEVIRLSLPQLTSERRKYILHVGTRALAYAAQTSVITSFALCIEDSTYSWENLADSNYGGPSCARFISTPGDVFGWRSASNYVKLQVGATKFAAKLLVVKQSSHERTGVLRCATIEEIEAEKSLIEKNVVSG